MSDFIEKESSFERCPEPRKKDYVLLNSDIIHSGLLTLEDIGYYGCYEGGGISWNEIPKESQKRLTNAFHIVEGR